MPLVFPLRSTNSVPSLPTHASRVPTWPVPVLHDCAAVPATRVALPVDAAVPTGATIAEPAANVEDAMHTDLLHVPVNPLKLMTVHTSWGVGGRWRYSRGHDSRGRHQHRHQHSSHPARQDSPHPGSVSTTADHRAATVVLRLVQWGSLGHDAACRLLETGRPSAAAGCKAGICSGWLNWPPPPVGGQAPRSLPDGCCVLRRSITTPDRRQPTDGQRQLCLAVRPVRPGQRVPDWAVDPLRYQRQVVFRTLVPDYAP